MHRGSHVLSMFPRRMEEATRLATRSGTCLSRLVCSRLLCRVTCCWRNEASCRRADPAARDSALGLLRMAASMMLDRTRLAQERGFVDKLSLSAQVEAPIRHRLRPFTVSPTSEPLPRVQQRQGSGCFLKLGKTEGWSL